jgi:hypothetical protein
MLSFSFFSSLRQEQLPPSAAQISAQHASMVQRVRTSLQQEFPVLPANYALKGFQPKRSGRKQLYFL